MVSPTNEAGLQTAPTPLWLEPRVGWELLKGSWSPTTYGFGIPKGNKQPVLLIPGFLANDISLWPLWHWLTWVFGSRPFLSELGSNDKCLNNQLHKLTRRVHSIRQTHGYQDKRVDVVGWSLGGILAGALKMVCPDDIGKVITLGTPQNLDAAVHPWIAQAAALTGRKIRQANGLPKCFTAECNCVFGQIVRKGISPDVCIYSSSDGIAEAAGTRHASDPTRDRHVWGATHLGMGFNPAVLREVALALVA